MYKILRDKKDLGRGVLLTKKMVVVIIILMTCLSMSGIGAAFTNFSKQNKTNTVLPTNTNDIKTTTETMENLKKSMYSYLNTDENPFLTPKDSIQSSFNVPWICPTSSIFEWWVRVKYNNETFQKQLDVSIYDFQQKFLKHPYYSEDVFFDIDSDPLDDLKVSFGFYWETILNSKTNIEHKSLESLIRVRQINGGPSDLYAGLEVWSEIHVNWGLIDEYGSNIYLSSETNYFHNQRTTQQPIKTCIAFRTLLQQKIRQNTPIGFILLQRILGGNLANTQGSALEEHLIENPVPSPADDDYFSVAVGYRTAPGEEIPLYTEKRFSFAKEDIFSPIIFQQIMKTEPSGLTPLQLLYGFRAYEGSTNTLKYDIAFSVEFSPFVTLKTQFIPLGGYIYYHFDTESQYPSQIKITYRSEILTGNGDGVSLSLIFDEIDSTMGQAGKWMSFGLRKNPHGFDYQANEIFNVAVVVDSPWFSQKVRLNGLPKTLSYEWKIFDDFEVSFIQGKLFYVNVRGYADISMSSSIKEIIVYYPKLRDPNDEDVPFLKVNNIPSSRKVEAKATLEIQNGSMLRIDANGYVDLTKSGPLGDITIFYPKATPEDPDVVLMRVPAGTINSQRVSAEATLYVDADNFSNVQNYIYGKIQRQADSNFNELNFYLPNVTVPLVQITDIPANAYATGTFWWNQLKGYGRAQRSSASQQPDPVHFNLVFDTLTFTDVFSIGDGHIQTDFKIAENGYFKFDTSHEVLGNMFSVGNSATGNSLSIGASTVSAQNFEASWGLNTTGEEPQIDSLALSGSLNALNDFVIAIALDGEVVDFTGDWCLGASGGFSIDVQQNTDMRIDLIHLTNYSGRLDLNGYVVLSNTLHYDMSWKWKQGTSLEDPGYFKINEGTNQPNLKEIAFDFVYKDESSVDRWGADLTLANFALYICVKWYWQSGLHIWPVIQVSGQLNLDMLLNYNWYHIWP
ncbi:hypothetical protein AYK25_07315 [Thermoplasmatales archaeon SM1-50]|nr:MAG: hypothetical protein AYK25_07315 [Thermoplasmatales archaeon SM1-50]